MSNENNNEGWVELPREYWRKEPTASSELTRVYSDCSYRNGVAVSSWWVSPTCFGAACVEAEDSNAAELSAALLALSHCTGPVNLVTDSLTVLHAIKGKGADGSWVHRMESHPDLDLLTLRREVESRGVIVSWQPGHGDLTPLGLKFCDILSRGISRRAEEIKLQVGDLLATPAQPGEWVRASQVRRSDLAPCLTESESIAHLTLHLLPSIS